jgi:hypothetical protein
MHKFRYYKGYQHNIKYILIMYPNYLSKVKTF